VSQSQGGGGTSTLVTKPPVPDDQKVIDLSVENANLKRKIEQLEATEGQKRKKRRVSTITLEDFNKLKDNGQDDEVEVLTVAQVRALMKETERKLIPKRPRELTSDEKANRIKQLKMELSQLEGE